MQIQDERGQEFIERQRKEKAEKMMTTRATFPLLDAKENMENHLTKNIVDEAVNLNT